MVLGYLARFPDAEDTLDGIADWWIPQQRIHVSVEQLVRVLRQLAEAGAVEPVGDGVRRRYRLRRSASPLEGNVTGEPAGAEA